MELPHGDGDTPIEWEGVEQPPLELKLRKSSRLHQPSRSYAMDEYVMLTNSTELKCHEVVEGELKEE